jgi:hypothetical protein
MKKFYLKSVLFAMGFILFASAGCNQPNLPNNDPLGLIPTRYRLS